MADREITNEEAIEILGGIRTCYNIFDEYDGPKYAALSKAIFALKAEPVKHGHWIVISEYPKKAECSHCGYPIEHELVCWWDYCPNCSARMFDKDTDVPDKNVGKIDEVEE